MLTFLALLVVLGIVLFVLRGSPELARLTVRGGVMKFTRGRLPGRLLDDFKDVLSDPSITEADVRIVVDGGSPRVVATGLSEAQLQQLRNVTGPYPVAQFRNGRRPA